MMVTALRERAVTDKLYVAVSSPTLVVSRTTPCFRCEVRDTSLKFWWIWFPSLPLSHCLRIVLLVSTTTSVFSVVRTKQCSSIHLITPSYYLAEPLLDIRLVRGINCSLRFVNNWQCELNNLQVAAYGVVAFSCSIKRAYVIFMNFLKFWR